MDKKQSSKNNDDRYPSGDSIVKETFPSSDEKEKFKQSDSVVLIFNQNRKFDLHIGNEMYTFLGREPKTLPRTVLKHPDFQNQREYFLIKGE